MKLQDVIFLVAAIIAWMYSSYRSYQKQLANKTKPQSDTLPSPEEVIPVPRSMTFPGKAKEKTTIPVRTKKDYETASRKSTAVSLEKIMTDINPELAGFPGDLPDSPQKAVVNKFQSIETEVASKNQSVDDLIEEIHSGKVDWRKAIILNELIRPVYFK